MEFKRIPQQTRKDAFKSMDARVKSITKCVPYSHTLATLPLAAADCKDWVELILQTAVEARE